MRWGKGKSPPIHHSDSMDLHSLLLRCFAMPLLYMDLNSMYMHMLFVLVFYVCVFMLYV